MLHDTTHPPSALAVRVRHHGPTAPPGQLNAAPFEVHFATDVADRRDLRALRAHGCSQGHVDKPAGIAIDLLDDVIRDGLAHDVLVRHARDDAPAATARITSGADLHELARNRASHFDLESLPTSHLDRSAWVDRIAIDPRYLEAGVLWPLVAGLYRYLDWNDLRFLLCPALVATQEPSRVAAASLELARGGHAGSRWTAPSQPDYLPEWSSPPAPAGDAALSPWLNLLRTLGAKVCGGPAVDASRGLTLFLMRLDIREVQPKFSVALPGPGCWEPRVRR